MTNLSLALKILNDYNDGKYGNRILTFNEMFKFAGYPTLLDDLTDEEWVEFAQALFK